MILVLLFHGQEHPFSFVQKIILVPSFLLLLNYGSSILRYLAEEVVAVVVELCIARQVN